MKKKVLIIVIVFVVLLILFGMVELKHEEVINEETNNIEEVINEETNNVEPVISEDTNNVEVVDTKDALSDELKSALALEVLKSYCKINDYEDMNEKGMPNILEGLGFMTREELNDYLDNTKPLENGYYKTEVKYEDFKEKMLSIFTEEYFNQNYTGYLNIDGYVGVVNIGIGRISVDVDSIISIEYKGDGKYNCTAKFIDIEALDHFNNPEPGETIEKQDCYFTAAVELKNVNNKLLINGFINGEN